MPGVELPPPLEPAIACFPAEALRAAVRLLLAAVPARWHLASEYSAGWPGFISFGHPRQGPTHARQARLEQVASWPLIFYERGSSDWTLTHSLSPLRRAVPNVALEADTIETAKRMVDRGLGMAFLPQLAVGQEVRSGNLCTVKLPAPPTPSAEA